MKPTNRVAANPKRGPKNIQSKTSHSEHRCKGELVQQTTASEGRGVESELDEFTAQLEKNRHELLKSFDGREGKLATAPAPGPGQSNPGQCREVEPAQQGATKPVGKTKTIQVWLPRELADRATFAAKTLGISRPDFINLAVAEKFGGAGDGVAQTVEIWLSFDAAQFQDLKRCAAFDNAADPADWVKMIALGSIPCTFEAIEDAGLTPEQREKRDERLRRAIKWVMSQANSFFSMEEMQAIALCAEWNGMNIPTYVRTIILSMVGTEFEEILSISEDPQKARKERNWARRFHRKLAPIFRRPGAI